MAIEIASDLPALFVVVYMAQAHARWLHPVASSEAPDVIHRAMRSDSYHCIAMAIEISIDSPAFFVAVNLLSPTTIDI
jgi:hypothetical protein